MYKQTKVPNLDPIIYQLGKILTSWLAYCLAYVQTAFGAGWAGATAWESWQSVKGKHTDRNFPIGVYVPIWFSHWGTYGGVYKNWGHVAIMKIEKDGTVRIWTSPLTNKPYADIFTGISQLERAFNATYVGWSEFVGPTRVLEYVPAIADSEIQKAYREILERNADADGLKHYRNQAAKGWTIDQIRNDLLTSQERKTLLANKEAARKAADEAARKAAEARRAAEVAKAKAEREAAEKAAKEALEAEREAERLRLEEERKKNEQAELINQPEPVETEPPKNEIDVEVIETPEEDIEVKDIPREHIDTESKEFKDGAASGSKFVARIITQYAFAATIVTGLNGIVSEQIDYLVLSSNQLGTLTLLVTLGLIVYNQIGYFVNEHPEVKQTAIAKLFKKWVF